MEIFIKDEPVEYEENSNSNKCGATLVEKNFEAESFFLKNLQENILNSNNEEDMKFFAEQIKQETPYRDVNNLNLRHQEISIEKVLSLINVSEEIQEDEEAREENEREEGREEERETEKRSIYNNNKNIEIFSAKKLTEKQKEQEKIALEKKRILISLVEAAKEDKKIQDLFQNCYDKLSEKQEKQILRQLNEIFENAERESLLKEKLDPNQIFKLRRFRTKLEIRELKRKKHIKLFDIDSYTNELIDSEKMNDLQRVNHDLWKIKTETQEASCKDGTTEMEDESVIFEYETLKESISKDGSKNFEIVAVTRVLDRFNTKSKNSNFSNFCSPISMRMPLGIVEFRNDDIKCLKSPFSQNFLKPYVRRDFESTPIKLLLNQQIKEKSSYSGENSNSLASYPIDYVHLRPEHVLSINLMCRQHFWSGIDVSECLQYPDYTIVCLYKKLIIGFAFLVPNTIKSHKEAYLSFIFVHPDWRSPINPNQNHISIGQYMLFYLIQSAKDSDITLHVSVNSRVVLFYQKFGFEIEEIIKNFYEKYYSQSDLSKDAFLMRLSRN